VEAPQSEHADTRHAFVAHTGEIELEIQAPSYSELLVEAGRGLAELMLGGPGSSDQEVHETAIVRAPDREGLLVAWLDELIFRSEIRGAIFTRFDLSLVGDLEVRAEIYGIAEPVLKTAVKAATYHRLQVLNQNGSWQARVILDV
jgi:SHS2 domain-containing protein